MTFCRSSEKEIFSGSPTDKNDAAGGTDTTMSFISIAPERSGDINRL
jgi:hypothetical protein